MRGSSIFFFYYSGEMGKGGGGREIFGECLSIVHVYPS